jgi:hypothetical protein
MSSVGFWLHTPLLPDPELLVAFIERLPRRLLNNLPTTVEEYEALRFQTGTLKAGRGGRRYLPYAFTQES